MANFYATYPFEASTGGGGGVTSLNSLTGAITLAAGAGISIGSLGSTITVTNTAANAITALHGDGTATGPGDALFTLATVNSNVGTFGSSTAIPTFTVNAKGLITAASTNVVIAPAGTLTGTTLNSTVVNSSLQTVGTLTSGTWHASVIDVLYGGTGSSTASGARVNLDIDQRSTFSDTNYTILSTDRYVAQVGTMSAPRTVTLPLASSVNPGQQLIVIDESGTVSTTNTITIQRAGSDLIDGNTSSMLRSAYGRAILYSNGTNAWTDAVTGVSRGGTGLQTLPTNGQLLIGSSTTSAYSLNTITAGPGITVTNGPGTIQINNSSIGVGTLSPGIVSDGIDGDVTISVNTTLTRDMDYNSLTVNAGVNLNTGGYTIFSKTSVSVAATGLITRNGNAGGNANAAGGAGAAGAALAGVTTGTGAAGAAGGAGTTAAGASGASSAAQSGEGGSGGVGGNGGVGSGGVGGSGGNSGALTIRYFRNVQPNWKYTAVGTYMPLGTGGAGGAAGGGDGTNLGRGGGGGGSSAGGILIICDSLNNLGTIQAKGGSGGNGGTAATGNVGGGAGGGGGGGGKIMIIANTLTSRGTLDVSGGAAGTGSAGAGTGSAGTNGSAGSPGYATTYEASTNTWTTTQ